MELTAADVMKREVSTASPRWSIIELEQALSEKKVGGFPVVEDGALRGVVSRSDVIRQLGVERTWASAFSDYFRGDESSEADELREILEGERFVAGRMATLRVEDVMSPPTFIASPGLQVQEVAALLLEHHIHRLPVVDGERLVGIITTLDIVALVARGGLRDPGASNPA